jgi:hypothetical protein
MVRVEVTKQAKSHQGEGDVLAEASRTRSLQGVEIRERLARSVTSNALPVLGATRSTVLLRAWKMFIWRRDYMLSSVAASVSLQS